MKTFEDFKNHIMVQDYSNKMWGGTWFNAFIEATEEGDDTPVYRNYVVMLYGSLFEFAIEMCNIDPNLFDVCLDQRDFKIKFYVNCNDYFYYASADAEEIEPHEIPEVNFIHRHLGTDGINAWTAWKRGVLPLPIYQDENFKKCYEMIPYAIDHFHYYLERHPGFMIAEDFE